jgi:DNA-binding winged helix-turn-helix (wHTH) protein
MALFFPIPSLFLPNEIEPPSTEPSNWGDVKKRSNGSARLRIGSIEADPKSCTLKFGNVSAKVSPRAMNVFAYLAERAGETVTHDELLTAFWRGPVSSTNVLHKCMTELRSALGNFTESDVHLDTIPRRGYRLTAGDGSENAFDLRSRAATFVSVGIRSVLILPSATSTAPEALETSSSCIAQSSRGSTKLVAPPLVSSNSIDSKQNESATTALFCDRAQPMTAF